MICYIRITDCLLTICTTLKTHYFIDLGQRNFFAYYFRYIYLLILSALF